jgi:PhnB protein
MQNRLSLSPYLTFNGNCREAMLFYKHCLGGQLKLQTMGESPMAANLPEGMREAIVHCTLVKDGFVLMGSDMVDDEGLKKGNNVSLMLDCSSETEIRELFENLSEGGTARHPVHSSFFGALFGDLTDKYGNQWLLHYNDKQS